MEDKIENKTYEEMMAAEEKVMKILANIDQVVKSALNRECGEKVAIELYAAQMDEAMQKSREALDKWLMTIQKEV